MADKEDGYEAQVSAAKERLRQCANASEGLRCVKDHPWLSVGGAFIAGFALMRSKLELQNIALLPLFAQLGSLLIKYSLESKK